MTATSRRAPAQTALGLTLVTTALGCALAGPQLAAGAAVPVSQPLVTLMNSHVARSKPSAQAHRIQTVSARRPLTHVRTVLPELGRATTGDVVWVNVMLPGRPNAHTGWIPAANTVPSATAWHVSIKLSTRSVSVYHAGQLSRRFRAVVGKPSTPTPSGRFFVEEVVTISSHDPGGPFALALSSRSKAFQEFDGGPGQIGLHGTHNLAGALGSAASHGCIRISPSAITWMAKRVNSGATLTITR
jgi:lipoprotein-anchoring transpeptidase ErfK/SrfK